ncbi:hypothetical protein Tco_1499840 [Tanacetum coccineum]
MADPTLQVPLDEIRVDDKLNFVEEPVEILKREVKKLKRSRMAIVKVRCNSKRGPEFTWEREDQVLKVECRPVDAVGCRPVFIPVIGEPFIWLSNIFTACDSSITKWLHNLEEDVEEVLFSHL